MPVLSCLWFAALGLAFITEIADRTAEGAVLGVKRPFFLTIHPPQSAQQ